MTILAEDIVKFVGMVMSIKGGDMDTGTKVKEIEVLAANRFRQIIGKYNYSTIKTYFMYHLFTLGLSFNMTDQ